MPIDSGEPWERLPGEGARAFEAFRKYLDLGPQRSHAKVAKKLGKSIALIGRWSRLHEWVRRADAWEASLDREWRDQHIRLVREACKNHHTLGQAMLGKIGKRLESLQPVEIEAKDVPRWVETLIKAQRQGLGMAASTVEHSGQGGGPVAVALDVDDRRKLMLPLLDNPEAKPLLERLRTMSMTAVAVESAQDGEPGVDDSSEPS